MAGELLDLATRIAARAEKGEDLEAFVTHERSFYVKAFEGEPEAVSSSEPRGAGARLVTDHRVGYAYTTDLTDEGLATLVADARDNARFSSPDDAAGLPDAGGTPPGEIAGLIDPAQPRVTAEEKVAFAIELERATRAVDPRVRTEEAIYSDSEAEVAIASSLGIEGAYAETNAWCYSVAIVTDGDDTQVAFDFDLARGLRGLDAGDLGERAARRALGVLGARKIPSARMPVIFDPYTAGQFLGVLASALTGEAVQKGRSLFANRIGETVAAGNLTLVDDGRIAGAPGSSPWDGEGVATQRTEVISSGVLRSFLYDTIAARRAGTASTGNASRSGFKSAPGIAPTNLAFDSTGETPAEVFAAAGSGLYVQDFNGVHSGANAVTGDFSVGATGRLLEDGVLGRPVKEVTIAAPMLEILSGIRAVATDRRWLPFGGSYGGATTLVGEMTVAGE
jgi:PmbA protein